MSLVNFNLHIAENEQQIPYSEQTHRFTDSILVEVTNVHALATKVVSPVFYMHGFQSVIELSLMKGCKNKTMFAINMMRPVDSMIACVLNENTEILVDQNKSVKFSMLNGQYVVDRKKSKSPFSDSVIFKVNVKSNAPVALIHMPEYSLNKLSFKRDISDLNDTVGWFLNEHLADISFKCINRKTKAIVKYPGHRMILSSSSPCIRKLLEESLSGGIVTIDFTEHSSESVHCLLRLLYTGQLIIAQDHLGDTLAVLDKYCSNAPVWNSVVEKLSNLVCSSTVLAIYEFASARATERVNLLNLRDYCLAFIDANADVVLTDESFLHINKTTLSSILQRDTLFTRESRLFTALAEWSKKKCAENCVKVCASNQLRFIGDSVKFIRFNAMTAKEFVCGPALSGLITNEDTIRFLMNVANGNPLSEALQEVAYFGKPRNQQTGWTNGLLDISTLIDSEVENDEVASAPSVNQLNEFSSSYDDNLEAKLNIMYPNLKG